MEMGKQQYGLQELQHYGAVLMGGEELSGDQQMGTPQLHEVQARSNMVPEPQIRLDSLGGFFGDGGGSNGYAKGRWPRQETLTLLEIRLRLDHKFKETVHKAPLWAEVSRVMAEEYGYQRSERKCREKLENLYKYYKKTKEGRAGRQDGKRYRFFRQLEALYGASSSNLNASGNAIITSSYNPALHVTSSNAQGNKEDHPNLENYVSFSNSFEFSTSSSSSSDEEDDGNHDLYGASFAGSVERDEKKKGDRNGWRSKIKEFVDSQLHKFMETQEAWLERLLKTLEQKEQERMTREEEWRRMEAARLDKESRSWAKERAWIEARDTALIEALEKISRRGRTAKTPTPDDHSSMDVMEGTVNVNNNNLNEQDEASSRRWPEPEITTLIKLRTSMEARFHEGGCPKKALWEEISAGMSTMGYRRNAKRCKEKWENINKYFRKTKECNKKRRENSKTCPYYKHLDALYSQGQLNPGGVEKHDEHEPSSSSDINASARSRQDCFYLLMDGGESLWEGQGNHTSVD